MDKIIHATAQSGGVRIVAAETTALVNEAVAKHNTMPTGLRYAPDQRRRGIRRCPGYRKSGRKGKRLYRQS